MRLENELAAALAHEVKNPLSLIKMNVDHLKTCLNEEFEDNFKVIEREICRINMIVTGLSFNRQPVYIKRLIDNIISEYDISLKQKNVRFNVEGAADIYAMGDSEKLNILFFNLIKNSVEAIKKDGEISITIKNVNGEITTEIEDNGGGIDPRIMQKIGQPYNTGKEGGTGLGLAICKSIVNEHRGKILFENTEKGAKVSVVLNAA